MEEKRYFGEPFKLNKIDKKNYVDIVEPNNDGSHNIRTDFQSYNGKLNHKVNSIFNDPTTESELIQNYREISEHQDVDFAIEEIVNELFVTDGESEPITLDLDVLDDINNNKKKEIQEEFQSILSMLNFNRDAFEIFKRFYIDSRLYYYKVVDPANLKEGIKELRYIDPMSIRKVREVITQNTQNTESQQVMDIMDTKEYFIYTPQNNLYNSDSGNNFGALSKESIKGILNNTTSNSYQLNSYSVAYVNSGLFDHNRNCVKGHLHKVTKPLNDLLNLETHMIIYRVARAPERRVFYIDTGGLPANKAQQYINLVQDSYRREVNYDASSGKIRSDSKTLSMHEDFWLPRSSNGKGTEVDTLQGASNLSQIEDIEYMDKKFKTSLNIPVARFDHENVGSVFFGSNNEMSRDEIKFQKFIGRLRARFNGLFRDILGTQLILKEVLSSDEWFEIENRIAFDYVRDTYIAESRKFAVLEKKAEVVKSLEELEGKYFSREYVWKEILNFSDEDIELEKERMSAEREEFGTEEDDF